MATRPDEAKQRLDHALDQAEAAITEGRNAVHGLRASATTVNDLARHMGVTPATMSLAIDRLERKAYVARTRDGVDRRRVHVRLTSAGVRIREASSVLDPDRVEALLARLTDAEREAAIRGLALLATAAHRPLVASPAAESRKEQRQ